jgi:hypothetical protein
MNIGRNNEWNISPPLPCHPCISSLILAVRVVKELIDCELRRNLLLEIT